MKKIILSFLCVASLLFAAGQDVEIKKDEVYLNGKVILKYKQINYIQHSFSSLAGDEVLFYRMDDRNTPNNTNDDYIILNFITAKKKVEISDFSRIYSMKIKKVMEKLIKWLVEDKVINESGEINNEKLEVFYDKFNDSNISKN